MKFHNQLVRVHQTDFEKDFLWGAATSAHQIDGDHRHNDWWEWELKGAIDGGVRSGKATQHRKLFRQDLELARGLGLNSYRFSFEWSWLEPKEGVWNSEAFDWYGELLSECERLGLLPMATLHHFTLPTWLAERGGFSSSEAPEKFLKFVKKVIESFGARIPLWCTINEPMVLVAGSYLGKFMPPGAYDPKGASLACSNLLKSHVRAYDLLHSEIQIRTGPFKRRPLEVGFAHNMIDFGPERIWHPLERIIAHFVSGLYNDRWLEAVNGQKQRFGLPGVFPYSTEVSIARKRRTFDFIGLNYYTRAYLQWRPRTKSKDRIEGLPIGVSFARRKEVASDLGWAIHPSGLKKMLMKLKSYRAPIYITENGIADANDENRKEYIGTHLSVLAEAIHEEGVSVKGYYHWSLLDNFEWVKGFWPRFGLFSVDYESFERRARDSAYFLREIIEAHRGHKLPNADVIRHLSEHS